MYMAMPIFMENYSWSKTKSYHASAFALFIGNCGAILNMALKNNQNYKFVAMVLQLAVIGSICGGKIYLKSQKFSGIIKFSLFSWVQARIQLFCLLYPLN